MRVVMQQALGPERCSETVEKPYPAGDQKHQEYEYDGVDLHALPVIIVQPQIFGPVFFLPDLAALQACSVSA